MRFEGKTALVTGGSQGIGEAAEVGVCPFVNLVVLIGDLVKKGAGIAGRPIPLGPVGHFLL